MRKMPVIEIENGKVKSIDGAGVGTDLFIARYVSRVTLI